MNVNIDNYLYPLFNSIFFFNYNIKNIYNSYILDLITNFQIFTNLQIYSNNIFICKFIALNYINVIYSDIINNNVGYFLYSKNIKVYNYFNFFFLPLFKFFFKLNIFFFIIYTIFFLTNLDNYIKQLKLINQLTRLFILNSTEKEVGPVDDYFFFTILFILTITMFIFSSILLILTQINILIWAVGSLFLMTFLILTIPISLFYDFGIMFSSAIRGSASGNNFIKEILFDIISFMTVFIRFIIQNIRFLFIFSGIFELLEWCMSINNSLFFSSIIINNNIFSNNILINNFFFIKNFNYLIINSILFIILYFYYLLHLLFLLLVQVTVYVGISIWLFFFLYSTKLLTKWDKYFIIKKNINWI